MYKKVEELTGQKEQESIQPSEGEQPAAQVVEQAAEVIPESPAQEAAPQVVVPEEVPSEPVSEVVKEEAVQEEKAPEDLTIEKVGEPKWYIVQTLTGQEDKVKSRIETTVEELGLKERILRVLVPEEETVEIKGDKRIERKRKMYPGYVFVEMILDEDTWYKIRSTAGVARFIGGKTSPVAVTDREMQRVLKQLGIKEKEITVEFSMGEPIRIISGSFRGYTGSVSEINATKSKLKAMINIFGRDTSVEVDFDRVEKVV